MDHDLLAFAEMREGRTRLGEGSRGVFSFGAFTAVPAARELFRDGVAVRLGGRAFDLLVLLLTSRGQVVSKEIIMHHVWPTTTVDESNLRFQMAALRAVLGDDRDRIKTITGRGYLFVAEDDHGALASALPDKIPQSTATSQSEDQPAIVIIDRNPHHREALQRLLRPFDAYVVSFGSFEAFVASGAHPHP